MKFCFIGGISFSIVLDFFVLFNVLCVGGFWLILVDKFKVGDWVVIELFVCEVVLLKG